MKQSVLPATQQEIDTYLKNLDKSRLECEQADEEYEVATKYHGQHEVWIAFARKSEANKRYLELNDWLLNHTQRGFFFDPIDQVFKLR